MLLFLIFSLADAFCSIQKAKFHHFFSEITPQTIIARYHISSKNNLVEIMPLDEAIEICLSSLTI